MKRIFVSMPGVTDPARHVDYNIWHQLDHLPENRALDGVHHGERFVRSPDCRAAERVSEPELSGADYFAMYWFREPYAHNIAEWQMLGETTLYEGRRPDLEWTERTLTGFLTATGGYVAPRVLVTPEAVPMRPGQGIVVRVSHMLNPSSAVAAADWDRRRGLREQVLATPGVTGTWTFVSDQIKLAPSVSLAAPTGGTTGILTTGSGPKIALTITWCDEDPIEVAQALYAIDDQPADPSVERVLWEGPLRTIRVGEWDWFSEANAQ